MTGALRQQRQRRRGAARRERVRKQEGEQRGTISGAGVSGTAASRPSLKTVHDAAPPEAPPARPPAPDRCPATHRMSTLPRRSAAAAWASMLSRPNSELMRISSAWHQPWNQHGISMGFSACNELTPAWDTLPQARRARSACRSAWPLAARRIAWPAAGEHRGSIRITHKRQQEWAGTSRRTCVHIQICSLRLLRTILRRGVQLLGRRSRRQLLLLLLLLVVERQRLLHESRHCIGLHSGGRQAQAGESGRQLGSRAE